MEYNELELKLQILDEVLKNVPFDGWTDATLINAAANINIIEPYCEMIFPNGIKDVIAFYLAQLDLRLKDQLNALDLTSLKVREKIFTAVKLRLQMHADNKIISKTLVKFFAYPQNIALGAKLNWQTVDNIWRSIGDKSIDFSYYSKRMILMAVYDSSLLYFHNDDSEGNKRSWEFLNKRIDNVLQINKIKNLKSSCKNIIKKVPFLRLIVTK